MYHQDYRTFIDFQTEDWDFIKQVLSQHDEINTSNISSVISNLQFNLWHTQNHSILDSSLVNLEEFVNTFKWSIPKILSLSDLFPSGLKPLYNQKMIKLSKKHCLSLLSALFFSCSNRIHTFLDSRELCKYQCMMTYFKLMREKSDEELENEFFFILNQKLDQNYRIHHWKSNTTQLKPMKIETTAKIEDLDDNFLKADFANQYIGGGVLNFGCVQEEILFSIYPELLVSMFFCRKMKNDEAIVLKGATRVANYSGYAWSFKFEGLYQKVQDPFKNTFVAIDALMFPSFHEQFNEENICREINKALAGFQKNLLENEELLCPVVTGKWGCGEFGGFAPLKTLLMWIAASQAGRDMIMTTFRDRNLEGLAEVAELYEGSSIGELVELIHDHPNHDILEFLIKHKRKPGSVSKTPIPQVTLNHPPFPNMNIQLKNEHHSTLSKKKPEEPHHQSIISGPKDLSSNNDKPPAIPIQDKDDPDNIEKESGQKDPQATSIESQSKSEKKTLESHFPSSDKTKLLLEEEKNHEFKEKRKDKKAARHLEDNEDIKRGEKNTFIETPEAARSSEHLEDMMQIDNLPVEEPQKNSRDLYHDSNKVLESKGDLEVPMDMDT